MSLLVVFIARGQTQVVFAYFTFLGHVTVVNVSLSWLIVMLLLLQFCFLVILDIDFGWVNTMLRWKNLRGQLVSLGLPLLADYLVEALRLILSLFLECILPSLLAEGLGIIKAITDLLANWGQLCVSIWHDWIQMADMMVLFVAQATREAALERLVLVNWDIVLWHDFLKRLFVVEIMHILQKLRRYHSHISVDGLLTGVQGQRISNRVQSTLREVGTLYVIFICWCELRHAFCRLLRLEYIYWILQRHWLSSASC